MFRASRLEALLEPLDHLLRTQAPASPLAPQTVVAAHPGMRQWLAGALARHRGVGDIVANLEIVLPSTFLDGLARELLGGSAVSPRAWRREALRWHLHALLERPADATLRAALEGGDTALRRFQLADRLARIYTQYMAYRPDWLRDWAAGKRGFDAAGFHPALWKALRQRLGADLHRGERLVALAERLRDAPPVPDADQPLHVFGLSHLAPAELAVLQALAVQRPVVLYVPDPCREFWGGLRSEPARLRALADDPHSEDSEAYFLEQTHPLLAAWGRLGQHFMLQLQDLEARLDVRHFRDDAGADQAPGSRLACLQESLRRLDPALSATDPRPAAARRADASLRVHACHTRLRELEVLRDALLRARADDPGIEPADIVVMAPDISAYVPLLPAVFGPAGEAGGDLPYHLADIPMARASTLLTAFRRLLALPASRLTAPEVVDFLGQPDVARRLGLDEDALDGLARGLAASRAAWGLDPGFRAALGVPARDENTLAWAMDRLVTSFVFGDEASEPVHRFPDQSAVAPVPGVGGGAGLALGALDHLLQQVAGLRADAAATLPASAWARRLEDRVDALLLEDPADPAAREAMASLRALLRSLATEPRDAGLDPPLSFPVVRRWLEEKLDAVPARQRFLAGGVTVCGMVPQRAIPFRVVAVLGLNEGDYPRGDVDAGLDPIRQPGLRRLGDRDTRSDDRYLFLETVMSARDRLHLSYVGRDVHDGRARNPASPLAELMAALPPGADGEAPEWRVDHPLQPFDARYFDAKDVRLYTYDAGQAGMVSGRADAPRLLSEAPAPRDDATLEVSLDALRRYFRDPARQLLATRLRARLDALDEAALAEDEPLEAKLGPLDRAARGLCLAALSDPDIELDDMPPEHLVLGGVLPAGALGARAWRAETEAAQQLVAVAKARADAASLFLPTLAPPVEAPAIQRQLGRFRLSGELAGVRERDGTLWVFEAFPHRKDEDAIGLGERIGLFLAWALLRLAPENAQRRVRVCALLPKPASPWQDRLRAEDEAFLAANADLRALLATSLSTRVQGLLEAFARPAPHAPWYFPRTSAAALVGQDVDQAWQAERDHAPGYARLLGRGLQLGAGEEDVERVLVDAARLAEAIGYVPPGAE
ncbi:MAG TPA: exodeoxyribonuclease V subunit gamma [Arenimonas sp.]|uniref:exodeoxyribonuclease V subunit gamma n=1 Tax=Arenimonas sp. TaxID=1872635 RepID=UPI002D7F5ABD|nr:exodeoxyribonuclease V subunit gamma [Arenimonas sp.]HEU0153652.1 exodeoxyribonuclease V subunit gamma [Arenimonas sp.]